MKFTSLKHAIAILALLTFFCFENLARLRAQGPRHRLRDQDPYTSFQSVLTQDAVNAFIVSREWKKADGTVLATGALHFPSITGLKPSLAFWTGEGLGDVVKIRTNANGMQEILLSDLSPACKNIIGEVWGMKKTVIYAPMPDGDLRIYCNSMIVGLVDEGTEYRSTEFLVTVHG